MCDVDGQKDAQMQHGGQHSRQHGEEQATETGQLDIILSSG